jgi:site-specific DNA-methyltransferase (adenine-specific)
MHEAVGKINRIRIDGQLTVDDLPFDGIDLVRTEVSAKCVAASNGWLLLFTLAEGVRAWRDDIQSAGGKWDTTCFWIKPDASPRFNGQGPARGAECIVTAWCGKGYRVWNGGGMRGVFTHNTNGPNREGTHPTEKPLSLMKQLVSLFTQPEELVCDPFMGSGTTGIACLDLGRKFIGIERDEKYFDLACKRLEAAHRQPKLFPEQAMKQTRMEL